MQYEELTTSGPQNKNGVATEIRVLEVGEHQFLYGYVEIMKVNCKIIDSGRAK